MILGQWVSKGRWQGREGVHGYHKFVKTTPKPRATKNSRGELVGPLPPEEPVLVGEGEDESEAAALGAVVVVADILCVLLGPHTTAH